jgi:hypothetical protein
MGFGGMLHRLSREFVSGQVVFLAVVHVSDAMGVCCEVVEFGGSSVRIVRHGCLSVLRVHPRPFEDWCPLGESRLLTDDFGVGAGGDEADEALSVEIEINFEVFGLHA